MCVGSRRIAPLSAQPQTRRLFERLVGKDSFAHVERSGTSVSAAGATDGGRGPLPREFLVVGVLLLLALAAHERWCSRVDIREAAAGGAR